MRNLNEALEALKPGIAAEFAIRVRRVYETLVACYGEGLKRYRSDMRAEFVKPALEATEVMPISKIPVAWAISEEKLAAYAAKYAERAVATWAGKIKAKVGNLDNAEVRSYGGTTFRVFGERAGAKVEIEQTMIINVSPRGKPFNQFPARIYVDGKFTSEKAYKEMA